MESQLTGHDCAYCGAILTPGESQVCREQGGDPPGTWVCSEGTPEDQGITPDSADTATLTDRRKA